MKHWLQFIFALLAASAFANAPERKGFPTTSFDAFSRVSVETNSIIRRTATGSVNGPATLRAYVNGQPVDVLHDPQAAGDWRTEMALMRGTNTLVVYADHPSGQFTTNRQSTFVVTNTAFDKEESLYDGAGNVTNRVWKDVGGTVVRSQALTWDALGRLVKIKERDTANNGFNYQSVFDGFGRQVRTVETVVSNNVALANPVIATFTYDPEAEFLIAGIHVSRGTDSRQDWLAHGPDISGGYGGMEGVGGLEAITSAASGVHTTAGVINDGFGNVIASVIGGSVSWNPARLNLYAPVEGFAPPRLSLDNPTYASLAWRTRPVNVAGLIQLGERPYDYTRRAFLAADPLGHEADPGLNTAFGGNPARFFDATGRDWRQQYQQMSYPDWLQDNIALYGRAPDYTRYSGVFGGNVYGWYGRPESGNVTVIGSGSSSFSIGSFAADTFLNQSDRDYAASEWNNADWRSPWGITVGVAAGVSWTANTIDMAANFIPLVGPVKSLAESAGKAGIKAVAGVFTKNVAEDIWRAEAKQIEESVTKLYRGVPSNGTEKSILAEQGVAVPRGTALDSVSLEKHVRGEDVNAGVTSWTTDRNIAVQRFAGPNGTVIEVEMNKVTGQIVPRPSVPKYGSEKEVLLKGTIQGTPTKP